ncbi:SixA phosphatase family protein [Parerythrobacter jejuensis]|uniref:Histidine phosphatase family protein n=1 Tax=Parerythrobacter jejuensis TaxID=795812 RepID=A0A845AM59_9SPHN|nr:histidine phosphatase family protein [Parerythrobacter jejuensis]MXP31872.1 histidine phosphatase family protein [Parerythrobacter jejuensis]
MKVLGLLRHAKSDWDDMSTRDFDRGLNARGRRGAALMGAHIRAQDQQWDCVLASPAERVRRTLESAELGVVPQWDQRLYLSSAETMIDVVGEKAGDADAVLIVAHNPGLQEILLKLIAPENENAAFDEASIKYPTAAFAIIELAIDDWSELGGENGILTHFKRPRDLDADLGPEG